MKIVWLSHSSTLLGGGELALTEATKALRAQGGHEVHVVTPEEGAMTEHMRLLGVRCSVISYPYWTSVGGTATSPSGWRRPLHTARRSRWLAEAVTRLVGLLRRERPDVVLTNTITVSAGALAARVVGIPHVWYVHELHGQEGHGLEFEYGARLSLKVVDRLSKQIIVNSHTVHTQLAREIPFGKLRRIYYAVEVPPQIRIEWRTPDKPLQLIHVGNMYAGKKQEDAVRAVALLKESGCDVYLKLVGGERDGYGSFLRQLASDLGVRDLIEIVAFTENPFSHTAASDVALMCSKGEAFGRVTVEAMKLGKPVVGARSGGTTELIRDGENGFLFEVGDPADLARKVELLYRDRELLKRLGANAEEWANKTFNLSKYGDDLIQVLREATDTTPPDISPARTS